jgi:hypothetical protein
MKTLKATVIIVVDDDNKTSIREHLEAILDCDTEDHLVLDYKIIEEQEQSLPIEDEVQQVPDPDIDSVTHVNYWDQWHQEANEWIIAQFEQEG